MFLGSLIDGITERFSTEYELQQVRFLRLPSHLNGDVTFSQINKTANFSCAVYTCLFFVTHFMWDSLAMFGVLGEEIGRGRCNLHLVVISSPTMILRIGPNVTRVCVCVCVCLCVSVCMCVCV